MKYEAFRELHERPGIFIIPNPWNAGSAKILTAIGFEALATTSAGYAFSVGLPDEPGSLKRDGVLANAREIVTATHLPVSADLQDGFGSTPKVVAETIRMASAIGLAGGSIEDASNDPAYPIYEFELAVERIAAAAVEARHAGFFLTARAEFRDRARGLDIGGVDYITKPFNPVELAPLVRALLDRLERGERDELRREKLTELRALMAET